jgi:hypothetical protein
VLGRTPALIGGSSLLFCVPLLSVHVSTARWSLKLERFAPEVLGLWRLLTRYGRRTAIRSFLIAFFATSVVWGVGLSSEQTFSPDAQTFTVRPSCRAAGDQLTCSAPFADTRVVDAGSPAWLMTPTSYLLRHARQRGEARPQWNPYDGSGYPLALDGHSARFSPTEWLLSHVPGDQGQDIVIFCRFLSWTFGLIWAIALFEKSVLLLTVMAFVVTMAPYGADYVHIAFLDADLSGPWFLLLLAQLSLGRIRLRTAMAGALALGLLVGTYAFPQAQVVLAVAMSVLAVLAASTVGSRALCLGGAFVCGVFLVLPSWIPMLANLDQFLTSRSVQCVCDQSLGWKTILTELTNLPAKQTAPNTVTMAGLVLLPWVPRRFWFVSVGVVLFGVWLALGLPHQACALPLVSGMRFSRHLLPHLQMLFLFAAGVAIHRLGLRFDRDRRPLLVLLPASVAAYYLAGSSPASVPALGKLLWAAALSATVFALLAIYLPWSRAFRSLRRITFALAVMGFVFPSYVLGSEITVRLMKRDGTTPQVSPLPAVIAASTPLGKVQELSRTEDRRHFSPHSLIYPNWSQALEILDLRSLNALYPSGIHQLNAGLFSKWERDPAHVLNPDRFTGPWRPAQYLGIDFQRVLALHRVSLLTFSLGQARFPRNPGPYQQSKCQLLAADSGQGTESYLCPEVGGVGFFPETVKLAGTQKDTVYTLKRMSPSDLLKTAFLGPELDPELGPAGPTVAKGQVVSMARSPNHLLYWLYVETPGTFVVADAYFRGWTATVNGKPVRISRANVAFKAVQVPKGFVDLHFHFKVAGP